MLELVLLIIVSTLISWSVTSLIVHFAYQLKLVHQPNQRSSHTKLTPHGGGIGIVVSTICFTLWLLWRDGGSHLSYWAAVGLSLVVAIKGLVDDIIHLSAILRFGIQIIVSSALVFTLYTLPIQGLETIAGLPLWISLIVVVFVGVWWLNLFNFMDGIDGIAGSQAVFMLGGAVFLIALVYPDVSNTTVWLWMLCLTAATFGFLLFNWAPAKIFLGDVGSTFLAYMIFFLALLTISNKWMNYASWAILAALFVSDATVTLLRRIVTRQKWLAAHRSHAYQYLSRRWGSHQKVTMLFIVVNLVWLLPLAWLSLIFPLKSYWLITVAYAPLILIFYKLGAGKLEQV